MRAPEAGRRYKHIEVGCRDVDHETSEDKRFWLLAKNNSSVAPAHPNVVEAGELLDRVLHFSG